MNRLASSSSASTRDPYFNVLKFVAILLVVYLHVSFSFNTSLGQPYIRNFIVGMNMPIFFIISGMFAARTIENGDWMRLGKHLLGYFWPVALVSCVFAVLEVIFHLPGSDKGLVGYAARNFLFSVWFLWCLAICFCLTFLCSRLKSSVFFVGVMVMYSYRPAIYILDVAYA